MKNLLSLLIFILSSFIENSFAQNIWEPTNGPNGVDIVDFIVAHDSLLVLSGVDVGIYN
jgi:hypothetical protein